MSRSRLLTGIGSFAYPQLATDWAFVDNSTALQLHLRKRVTFIDGTPFNAAAVKANLERDKTLKGSTAASELGSVAGVDVIDDSTVKIRLNPGTGATLIDSLSNKPGYMVSPAARVQDVLAEMVMNAINVVVWYRDHYSETRHNVEVPWLGIQSADYAAIVKYK